jgi:hypothetical protein
MGYFRHKLNRARSRDAIDRTLRRQSVALTAAPSYVSTSPDEIRLPCVYRRYVVKGIDPDSQHHRGLFMAADELRNSDALWHDEAERLRRALNWFNTNLTVPKGIPPRAIFWFKPDAEDCRRRAYEIVRLLRAYRYAVWVYEAVRPGRVIYDDAQQVAVVPFSVRGWTRTEPVWAWEPATD